MECNGCTMCCMVLPISWVDKEPGVWCKHCDIGKGCRVFGNGLDDECGKFQCIYNLGDNLPIELRPDKCKIIFENVDNSIVLGTMHPNYNEAYKKKVMEKQVKSFLKKGISVVINSFTIENPLVFPAKERQTSEVWSSLQAKWKERNDSSSIHN